MFGEGNLTSITARGLAADRSETESDRVEYAPDSQDLRSPGSLRGVSASAKQTRYQLLLVRFSSCQFCLTYQRTEDLTATQPPLF